MCGVGHLAAGVDDNLAHKGAAPEPGTQVREQLRTQGLLLRRVLWVDTVELVWANHMACKRRGSTAQGLIP